MKKPTNMKSRNTIRMSFLGLILVAAFFALRSAIPSERENACKESMDCCKKKNGGAEKMVWENLSHQFFSSL